MPITLNFAATSGCHYITDVTRLGLVVLSLIIASTALANESLPPPCSGLFTNTKAQAALLPFQAEMSVDAGAWSKEFIARYQKSFNYDYAQNTQEPDAQIQSPIHVDFARRSRVPLANGAMITGDEHYPTEIVLRNLGLNPQSLNLPKRQLIISVGEGRSGLVSFLRKARFSAIGLDIWYDKEEMLDRLWLTRELLFIRKNRKHLRAASAIALPFNTETVRVVLSHQVFQGLSVQDQDLALQEMIRVLQPGGEVRLSFRGPYLMTTIDRYSQIPWLEFDRKNVTSTWLYKGRKLTTTSTLLLIHKRAPYNDRTFTH